MKIKIIEQPKSILFNRDSFHNYFAWPTVAKLNNGALMTVASGYRLRHVCPFGKCVASYSFDGGANWTRPAPVIDTMLDDRDAGICVSGNKVIVTSFNLDIATQRNWNTDKMQSYYNFAYDDYIDSYLNKLEVAEVEERYLGSLYTVSSDNGYAFGEIKKCPITSPHGPSATNDGQFFYVGRDFSAPDVTSSPVLFCYFMDEKGEFKLRGEIPSLPDHEELCVYEPHAIMLPDGKIVVHIRVEEAHPLNYDERVFTVYQSESYDNGHTFTVPHPITDLEGGAPAHLLLLRDGRILSTYGYRKKPYSIRIMCSEDNGNTWDVNNTVLPLLSDSSDIGYPASVQLDNGNILTVFYAHTKNNGPSEIMQVIWSFE